MWVRVTCTLAPSFPASPSAQAREEEIVISETKGVSAFSVLRFPA